jgi:uncharacterized protein
MSSDRTPADVFRQLVAGVAAGGVPAGALRGGDLRGAPTPSVWERPITSRAELREHFRPAAGAPPLPKRTVENVVIHQTVDSEVIIAEFEYHGAATDTGAPTVIPGIFAMRVRNGEILMSSRPSF